MYKRGQSQSSNANKIQAVIFNKHVWTTASARQWLQTHNYTPIKDVHETKNYYRYRIQPPETFRGYYSLPMNKYPGVILIIGITRVKASQ